MRMSATVRLSGSRNDLPPSRRELPASGNPWSAPHKREVDRPAKQMKVNSLSAGRNRKSDFRRIRLQVARPGRSLFPMPKSRPALRKHCGKVPGCDESGRPRILLDLLLPTIRHQEQELRCRLHKAEAKSLAADRRMRARPRGIEQRLVARWYFRRGRSCCHQRRPCLHRDESCCIRRARKHEPVRKPCPSPRPTAALAKDTGRGGRRPTTDVRAEVPRAVLRNERTRRTETEFALSNRRIDLPGLMWIRCAELSHRRRPAELLRRSRWDEPNTPRTHRLSRLADCDARCLGVVDLRSWAEIPRLGSYSG